MSFGHLHREAQIALVDRAEDSDVHIRYTVATIPRATPCIITTNLDPYLILQLHDEAINRRCQCIQVNKTNGVYTYTEIK